MGYLSRPPTLEYSSRATGLVNDCVSLILKAHVAETYAFSSVPCHTVLVERAFKDEEITSQDRHG